METPKEHSAGFIVARKGPKGPEYLLLQSRSGTWLPPKGHLEPGETVDEASIRELEEETGLSKHIKKVPGNEFDIYYDTWKGRKRVTFFLATLEADVQPVLSHEHQSFMWLRPHQAVEHMKKATKEQMKGILDKCETALSMH